MAEKRPSPSSAARERPREKRQVVRNLQHTQHRPEHVEPVPPSAAFTQAQMLKSIGAALTAAGFDGVQPAALEMFRSHTEEYMLHFATYIRTSMNSGRRMTPIAQDFSMALSLTPNTASASLLRPQLQLPLPESISYPSIPEPDPAEPALPDFSGLLHSLTSRSQPGYIPSHFPALPPKHSWQQTPVFPKREKDVRQMREEATKEGMLAEQALRKLATAAKAGAEKAEKRRGNILSGPGKARGGVSGKWAAGKEESFADLLSDGGVVGEGGVRMGQAGDRGSNEGGTDNAVVNYDLSHWRRGGQRRGARR
ncbi:hypothetical protein LTS14_001313 [Recurvomyces mirabilis]|nr:hypothetical protein LTS14_001313 [Recurvomyces mirabilis]